jgi:hydrogenase maturation protease
MNPAVDNRPLVIGIGNAYRCDDALGILVARELGRRHPADVRVIEAGGEVAGLLESWKHQKSVAVVDAVGRGNSPGQVLRLDALREPLVPGQFHSSSHEFGLAEAVRLARNLSSLPASLIVYGIEGQAFETGIGLSDPVVKSLPELIRMIEEDLHLSPSS